MKLIFLKKNIFNLSVKHQSFLKTSHFMIRNKRQTDKEKEEEFKELHPQMNEELKSEEEKKASMKEKIQNFFTFRKSATHIFADGGKDAEKDEEEEVKQFGTETNSALEFDETAYEEVAKSNEFLKLFDTKEVDDKVIEEVQIEVIAEKSAFSEFKEYLNVTNNYKIVKNAYQTKDFNKDIKPHLELLSNEFKLKKEYLQTIYRN